MSDATPTIAGADRGRTKLHSFVVDEVSRFAQHLAGLVEAAALERAEAAVRATVVKAEEALKGQALENERLAGEVEGLRRQLETLTSALQAERANAKAAHFEAEKAQFARARAEDACEQAEAARHQLAVTLERELRDVRAELDVQLAEVARLRQTEGDLPEQANVARAIAAPESLAAAAESAFDSQEEALIALVAEEPRSASVTPIRGSADSILAESASLVLHEVESRYTADVEAGMDPAQLVDRLAAHLEHARSMYVRCLESVGGQDTHAFERELARLIDQHGTTAFGRHLAVASYTEEQRAAAPQRLTVRAS